MMTLTVRVLCALMVFILQPVICSESLYGPSVLEGYRKYTKNDQIKVQLRYVAENLRVFKFFTIDPRLKHSATYPAVPTLMKRFPTYPVPEVPLELEESCTRGAEMCIEYAYKALQNTIPKLTKYEIFFYKVSLMYYLCYYTMLQQVVLMNFMQKCQIYREGVHHQDYREEDAEPYQCALFSFCPDPCCGFLAGNVFSFHGFVIIYAPGGVTKSVMNCGYHEDFPCGLHGPACYIDFKKNTNFGDLMRSKFNTSCNCARYNKGYIWDQTARMCVDYDECRYGNFECENNSVCRNLAGDYYCSCTLGYVFSAEEQECIQDKTFEIDDELLQDAGVRKLKEKKKAWVTKLVEMFGKFFAFNKKPPIPKG